MAHTTNSPKILKNGLLAAVLLTSLLSCGERAAQTPEGGSAEKSPVEAPGGIIPLDLARTEFKRYSERRAPLIQRYEDSLLRSEGVDTTFAVARYVAFDYAQLRQYMEFIEQEAQNAGTEISSLRVYFGNNPETGDHVHPRQNTVFLIPAARPNKERDEQFGLYIQPDGQPGFLNLELDPAGAMGMQGDGEPRSEASLLPLPAAAANLQGGQSLILNFGGSAPPPHN